MDCIDLDLLLIFLFTTLLPPLHLARRIGKRFSYLAPLLNDIMKLLLFNIRMRCNYI